MRHKGSYSGSCRMRWLREVGGARSSAQCKIWLTWSNTATYSILGLLMCLVPLCSNRENMCFVAAGQEDGVKERERGGLQKPRQGCHSAGQSPALHMSSSSTHNSTTQRDKRWRVGRSAHTHTTLFYPPFFPISLFICHSLHFNPLHPPLHCQPTNLHSFSRQEMWRLTGLSSCLKQQQKERRVIVALLSSSKDVGAHKPNVYLDHKGGWREGK